ncbi:MAG TPA: MotA/TolQ/ExbB proton channel family protein [Rhizomicrobium sp.]|nr:MotA/TolQ/ExbB proton channel family protein [Rhizomicrobium sp.]
MNLGYVFQHGDPVLIAVFVGLGLMSVMTWALMAYRLVGLAAFRMRSEKFLKDFWDCENWDDALQLSRSTNAPVARIAQGAIEAHRRYGAHANSTLGVACDLDAYLVRAIRNAMDIASARLEIGLTVLASVGSTAPFLGLFGTVWGIYGTLTNIGLKGSASLETVAGPMGEALVATAAGLAAALPAVLAYNALVRGNRLMTNMMDGFAHDLHSHLLTVPVRAEPSPRNGEQHRLRLAEF